MRQLGSRTVLRRFGALIALRRIGIRYTSRRIEPDHLATIRFGRPPDLAIGRLDWEGSATLTSRVESRIAANPDALASRASNALATDKAIRIAATDRANDKADCIATTDLAADKAAYIAANNLAEAISASQISIRPCGGSRLRFRSRNQATLAACLNPSR